MARRKFEDDGRTIADMSDIGSFAGPSMFGRVDGLRKKKAPEEPSTPLSEEDQFTGEEKRWFLLGALKASLLIGGVFIGGLALVVLLLIALWTIL